ncbi:MAG: OmpA family protein [Ferruginibacter sp.]
MKHLQRNIFLPVVVLMVMTAGCDTVRRTSNQDKGVVIGAAGGAIIGGILGNNIGKGNNTALGAIIGTAVGGVAGGIIGNKMDRQAEKIKTELPGAKVERVGEGIAVVFDDNNPDGSKTGVFFKTNKYDIDDNSKLALEKLQKIFAEYPETNILVEGHTDNVGTAAYNMTLSEKRAVAVTDYLKNAGVSSSRIITKWYGETQPKVENNSDANKALNRRVQFVITANEKMKADAKKEAEKP